jgi:hypothetical protein
MFDYLFVCCSCLSNFSAIRRLSPLPVTRLQSLALKTSLSSEGSFTCYTCCDTGLRFIRSTEGPAPISQSGIRTHDVRIIRSLRRCSNRCTTPAIISYQNASIRTCISKCIKMHASPNIPNWLRITKLKCIQTPCKIHCNIVPNVNYICGWYRNEVHILHERLHH